MIETISNTERAEFLRLIEDSIAETQEAIRGLENLLKDNAESHADHRPSTSNPDDFVAAAQISRNAECELRRERTQLLELRNAHIRLREGAFGTCATCKKPIPHKRLFALPTAKTCIKCAR